MNDVACELERNLHRAGSSVRGIQDSLGHIAGAGYLRERCVGPVCPFEIRRHHAVDRRPTPTVELDEAVIPARYGEDAGPT